jgi:hypothetical protein
MGDRHHPKFCVMEIVDDAIWKLYSGKRRRFLPVAPILGYARSSAQSSLKLRDEGQAEIRAAFPSVIDSCLD